MASQPKRARVSQTQETVVVDLSVLQGLFGEDDLDFEVRRRQTFETRKGLLSEAGTVNYDTYLYYIGMELKTKSEVCAVFFSFKFCPIFSI